MYLEPVYHGGEIIDGAVYVIQDHQNDGKMIYVWYAVVGVRRIGVILNVMDYWRYIKIKKNSKIMYIYAVNVVGIMLMHTLLIKDELLII